MVQRLDNNSTKVEKSVEEASLLRSSSYSSHESINFPETPRKDVDQNNADVIVDNLNQEKIQTIHLLEGSCKENESENIQEDHGVFSGNLNEENIHGIHLPQENNERSYYKYSDESLQTSSINPDDQNLNIQSSQENLNLMSSRAHTETYNQDNAKQDFQDTEMMHKNLSQEKMNAIRELLCPTGKTPNLQDELFPMSPANSFSQNINLPPPEEVYISIDGSEFESLQDKDETCEESKIIEDHNEDQGSEHRELSLEPPMISADQIISLSKDISSEGRGSPQNHVSSNNNADEDSKLNGKNEIQEIEHKSNEPMNEFQIESLEVQERSGPQLENYLDELHTGSLKVQEGTILQPDNDPDELLIRSHKVQECTIPQPDNDPYEFLIGPLFDSSYNNLSNNDLNTQGREDLNEHIKPKIFNTIQLIDDVNKKTETICQEEYQLESSPNYNNDYDPDIPGSDITVKSEREDNSELTEKKKSMEADIIHDKVISETSTDFDSKSVSKENRNNSSAALSENTAKEQHNEEPPKKTSVRSLITRAIENSPETIAQRSGEKKVEDIKVDNKKVKDLKDKGTKEKTISKPYFQNLAPFANGANGAPCSMAAAISGLIVPRV